MITNFSSLSLFVSHQYFLIIIDMMQIGIFFLFNLLLIWCKTLGVILNSWKGQFSLEKTKYDILQMHAWPLNIENAYSKLFFLNHKCIMDQLKWNLIMNHIKEFFFNPLNDFEIENGDDKKQCEWRLTIYFVLKGYF